MNVKSIAWYCTAVDSRYVELQITPNNSSLLSYRYAAWGNCTWQHVALWLCVAG